MKNYRCAIFGQNTICFKWGFDEDDEYCIAMKQELLQKIMELLHARLVRTTTCVDGCKCDYAICGDKNPYLKEHPEYRDEAGYRRNK